MRGFVGAQFVLDGQRNASEIVGRLHVVRPESGRFELGAEERDRLLEDARHQRAQPLVLQRTQLVARHRLNVRAPELGHARMLLRTG